MELKKSLSGIVLYANAPEDLAQFYVDHLGMEVTHTEGELRLAYKRGGAYLALRQAQSGPAYQHGLNDRYWKIGITLPNVDMAYDQLAAKGIAVTKPAQFRDIGYLCKVIDPEGFQIELLQHTFEGDPLTAPGDKAQPLGGGGILGHITLRSDNIDNDFAHFQDALGMKLLSVQLVPSHDFDLYFWAYTDETPPNPDLESVENRPWLWQRPYAVLEIQHRTQAGVCMQVPPANSAGYALVRTEQESC